MNGIPKYLVLPDKVYALTAEMAEGGRAFDRGLVDYLVEGRNPMSDADTWGTRLGMSRELSDDYPSFKEEVPIEATHNTLHREGYPEDTWKAVQE